MVETENQRARVHWYKEDRPLPRDPSLIHSQDAANRGNAFEKVALHSYVWAMRSKTAKDFQSAIKRSVSDQQRATSYFAKLGARARAKGLRSQAMEALLRSWLSKSPLDRIRLLDRSWDIARRSLKYFETANDYHEYAETYNRLSFGVALSVEYDGNLRSRIRKIQDALECGRKAIDKARSVGNKEQLVKVLVRASLLIDALSDNSSDKSKLREYRRESLQLWQEALRESREFTLRQISHPLFGFHEILDPSLNLALCKEALKIVQPQGDNFAIGRLMDYLAKWTCYAAESSQSSENPSSRRKKHMEALRFAEEAAKHYDKINFTSPIAGVLWVHSPYTEHFQYMGRCETDPGKRLLVEEKGLQCASELLRLAKRSGSPRVRFYALYTSSKSEIFLAERQSNKRGKKTLLRRGLLHRSEACRLLDQIDPFLTFNRGAALRSLAEAQAKLAELEEDSASQTELLLEAVENQEKGLSITTTFVQTLETPDNPVLAAQIGLYYKEYGSILLRLQSLTKKQNYLRKAVKAYSTAAEWYGRIPRYDRLAECYWKSAETYDRLQIYSLAAENFTLAAKAYTDLGRRVRPLREHSQDYAHYLHGWSKIEVARAFHEGAQHRLAAKAYLSAAQWHKSTKRWNFLTPYYLAWFKLESGENFSKKGDRDAAGRTFREAASLFATSAVLAKERLALVDQLDERTMVAKISNAPNEAYCLARITLEGAIEAESRGDYRTSCEKFGLASGKLKAISALAKSDQDQKETAFLSILSKAWQLSSRAELDHSIELLERACDLFKSATKTSPSENALKLASGHEAFCKALIASRKFADTLDVKFHIEASTQLGLAEGYYADSGFRTASHAAKGRKLLLEAFSRLNGVEDERDHRKKTAIYRLTGILLEESADAFLRARQPVRRVQVLELLERTRAESKIALQVTEILETASEGPTNIAFQTLSQGDEKAVGLERFERADIDARLVTVINGSDSDKNLELEIEISNTGRQSIRLVRLDDAIPPGSSRVDANETERSQGSSLVLSPQRIAPSETVRIRIVIKPEREGLLRLRPRVIFVDESDFQWDRLMEPRILPTSRMIEYLAWSFVKDNTDRRIALPNCGWRTLMEIVKWLKIPRSHVYGESRYGRAFGRQLETLVKSSLVEYRTFPGERGRGGDITRVRILLDNEDVQRYIGQLLPS